MSKRILLCFVLLFVLALVTSLSHGKEEPHVVTKHDKDGVLTVVIDMSGKKKVAKKIVEKKKAEKVDESKLKVDDLSKQAAAIIESSISSKEATQIAENLLALANEIRNVEKLIPSDQKDKKDLKDQLTVIISNLVQQAESPKALLLESSLALVAQQKKAEQAAPVDYDKVSVDSLLQNKKSTKGAKTLIIPSNIWDWTALGMNLVDGIGTYSQKFNKVGQFMGGKVADKLEKWNMKPLASVARNTGSSISSYSKKLEPYEQKAAKFIAPVVKSKTFQTIRKSVNVVSGVLSIKGGLEALKLIKGGGVKLPTSFAQLKGTLSKVVTKSNALIKNGKNFITSSGKVTKVVGASKKALVAASQLAKANGSHLKGLSTWNKIRHVDSIKTGYDSAKDLKSDAKTVKNKVNNRLAKMNENSQKRNIVKNRNTIGTVSNNSRRSTSVASSRRTNPSQAVRRSSTSTTPAKRRTTTKSTSRTSSNNRSQASRRTSNGSSRSSSTSRKSSSSSSGKKGGK